MKKLFLLLLLFSVILLSCTERTKFRLLDSSKTGIDFNNTITESDSFNVLTYEYIYNGAGVGAGDLNNDGLADLVFAGNQVSPRIYLNEGNFKFRDITSNFEGLTNNQWYGSVTLVDINGDRWLDVFLTSTTDPDKNRCKDRLWVWQGTDDNGDPYYKEMAEEYGIADDGQSTSAAFFDYDNDGDLDLYLLLNTENKRMNTEITARISDGSAANNDRLYRNNGDGTFTHVSDQAGIVYDGYGLGIAMGDINKDGFPDIYISNDFYSNDLLYINRGNGTFSNEIKKYTSYQTRSSMGNDMADVNNDGNPDIFTLDMLPENYSKQRQTISGFGYLFYEINLKYGFEHQYVRNMLHLHNGFINREMLPYSEVGQMMGISATGWSWSPLFADYDNDGDNDLIVTNGFPVDMTDKDWTVYEKKYYGYLVDALDVIAMAPQAKVQNFAFENTGEMHFINRSKEWLPDIPSFSNGAAFVDLDNDGDLDYVTNNINDKAFVMRNYTTERSNKNANYVKIKLIGEGGNTMALGAKVELWTNGKYQFHEHFLSRGYASSVDPVIHFGLAEETKIDSIRVTWPASGKRTKVTNPTVNQTIEINVTNSLSALTEATNSTTGFLFEKCDNMLDYVHEQEDFPDFYTGQNIIPHKFSQIGPRIAKGDIDGDGEDDLLIGSTNILPTSAFLRRGDEFRKSEIEGLTTQKEFSEADLSIFDVDGDGDNDIVAVAGGYENQYESDYKHFLYENQNGQFKRTPLPIPPFIASVLRPCDFDHDGDMDFFVGSRVKNGIFPNANPSWVIINNNGQLVADTTFRFNLGMVTDAVWSDYDNDGWEDLIVAREWNSLLILKNENGEKLEAPSIPGLPEKSGLWYTVAAGDFDNDGDNDYFAGNLGENHRFTISDKYPLTLYVLDLDLNGTIDPISTAYWEDENNKMQEYPINYLDELMGQSTYFQNLFPGYKSFSYSTINQILNENLMKRLEYKLNVNTTSSYILWNENGTFRWEKLPLKLQVSPITKVIVRDFNSDGNPDILIGGNDHTYDVSTGYYDANKGFVLLGKGKEQSFDILPPSESGILLNGMVESLLYIDGKTQLVVAGINREKAVVYKSIPPSPAPR